ncbi:MAG: PD40 domain-containing protein [Candidatus Sericytochromatia bacterium]|nr:PD40 domain-containing protein [Candidatus Sericytochromatia bacterium]
MTRPLRRTVLALTLLLAGCSAFVPQGGISDVRGRVMSLSPPKPLAGIRIVAKQATADTYTDKNGEFLLKDLPTNWQDIRVDVEGYHPLVRRLKVEPYGTKYVDFSLQAAGTPLPKPELLFERNGEIWNTDRLGMRQTQLTGADTWQWRQPVWAPDHRRWAVLGINLSPRAAEPPGVWLSDGDAGPVRVAALPATPLGLSWRGGPFLVCLDGPGMNQGMGRGTMLAMVERGKNVRFLSPGNGEGFPNLSPDGKRIAYTVYSGNVADYLGTSRRPQGRTQIVVANHGGANARELTAEGDNLDPAWSPDGRQIAFISNREGGAELWLMDADGTNQRQVTWTRAKRANNPCWSPDGKSIALNTSFKETFPSPRAKSLWQVALATGNLAMISNDAVTASW